MAKSRQALVDEIVAKLPEGWEAMPPDHQLHHWIVAGNEVLVPDTDFVLIPKETNFTVIELLKILDERN